MFFDRFIPQRTPPVQYSPVASTDWTGMSFRFTQADLSLSIADARRLAKEPQWDLKELATAIKASRLTEVPLQTPPLIIDFAKMRPTIRGLSELTSNDGRERGKFVFLDLAHTQLIMGETCTGDRRRVAIFERIPVSEKERALVPVLDLHTHPTNWVTKTAALHFSKADLNSLMKSKELYGSLVIARDAALFVLKS